MLNINQGFTYNKFEKPSDWPKVEDTFDYKYDNGKLIGGNKNLFLSGPVTYTVVGSPTIVDNVASGFTGTAYTQIDSNLTFNSTSDLRIVTRFQTPDVLEANVTAILQCDNPAGVSFIYTYSNGFYVVPARLQAGNVVYGLSTNTWYKADITIGSNKTKCDLYNDDGTLFATKTFDTTFSDVTYTLYFGRQQGYGTKPRIKSIDFNNTYIIKDNQLWFYGKNYATSNMVPVPKGLEYNNTTTPEIGWVYTDTNPVKGPVNYTVVGNPKIVDGVASGFSTSDYLRVTGFNSGSSFEINLAITPNSNGYQNVFRSQNFDFVITGGGEGLFRILGTAYEFSCGSVTVGTKTSYRFVYDGTNGYTYKNETLVTTSAAKISLLNQTFLIGSYGADTTPLDGSIDLNSTYIMINGQPWFGNCPMFQNFIPAPEGTMIGKDDTHSLTVETYQDKGIVDYTVVGSPTIKDGVASGFSTTDYVETSQQAPLSTDIIYVCKFKTEENGAVVQPVLRLGGGRSVLYLYNNKICIEAYDENDTYFATAGTSTLSVDTYYFVKMVVSGTTATISISSDDINYTTEITHSYSLSQQSTVILGSNNPSYLAGSIDLKSTYIMVNGQYWFHPYPNSYPKLVGPVNYTVVGSPTITDGIASNFITDTNYLTVPGFDTSKPWEFVIKAKISDTGHNFWLFGGASSNGVNAFFGARIEYTLDNCYYFLGSADDWTFDIVQSSMPYTAGVWYYYKFEYTGSEYIFSYKQDGASSYTVSQTVTSSTPVASIANLFIGNWFGATSETGQIDLNETYIKVNGSLWFGKENWKPSTYTDNSIYLLTGHKSDYSQYNELDFTPEITDNNTYNVSIDNQEIFTGMSSGTHIEWDKLALTTGYNITTPSALKAHVIKISPTDNTKNITRYYCDSNYVIKDGKLVWADPNIYLEGATGIREAYLKSGVIPTNNTTFEIKCKNNEQAQNTYTWFFDGGAANSSTNALGMTYGRNNSILNVFAASTYFSFQNTSSSDIYNVKTSISGSDYIVDLNGTSITKTNTTFTDTPAEIIIFGIGLSTGPYIGETSENYIYYLKFFENNVLIRHFVPVPTGLKIGNFTVPSNGMFDMVNQQFYANQGTGEFTYGKDLN